MRSDVQLKRLLKLVPYLQKHQGVTIHEAAEHFGTTPRQILTDLEVLYYCGLPGGLWDDLFDVDLEGAREDGHIFFRNADVLAQPMRMSRAEATSLLAALTVAVEVSGGSGAATSVLQKLRDALGVTEPDVDVAVASGRPEHTRELQRAVEERQVTRLRYAGGPGSEPSQPLVEPGRIRAVGGFTYLDAWSRDRDAWRSYRLDRIEAVEAGDERFDPREAPEGEDWFSDVTEELTLVVAPEAAWIAEYYPTRSVEPAGDHIRITIPVASKAWATGLLLRLGDAVAEVSDPVVARAAAREAAGALAHYG